MINKIFKSIYYRGAFNSFGLLIDYLSRKFLSKYLSICTYLKIKSFLKIGYVVNIKKPKTFNECILNFKIFRDNSHLSIYADKLEVREILKKKNYGAILNELYYKSTDFIDFDISILPESFVMKANNGSGLIRIFYKTNSNTLNDILNISNKWLKLKYNASVGGTDYHYDAIKPCVFFEKILKNRNGTPLLDYKFYCFNGNVEFIDIVDNSKGIPLMYVYDKEWNQLPFGLYNKYIKGDFPKPSKLKEMIQISEELSNEFDFVRIDLYLIDNETIVFGEYTFFPGGGMLNFRPKEYDTLYGNKLI